MLLWLSLVTNCNVKCLCHCPLQEEHVSFTVTSKRSSCVFGFWNAIFRTFPRPNELESRMESRRTTHTLLLVKSDGRAKRIIKKNISGSVRTGDGFPRSPTTEQTKLPENLKVRCDKYKTCSHLLLILKFGEVPHPKVSRLAKLLVSQRPSHAFCCFHSHQTIQQEEHSFRDTSIAVSLCSRLVLSAYQVVLSTARLTISGSLSAVVVLILCELHLLGSDIIAKKPVLEYHAHSCTFFVTFES